ncbi:MAG: hypothetical protein SNJ71_03385, partial [Bacteroidales bacterium]
YSCYMDDAEECLFVRYDRYSTSYKVVEFKTGYIKKIACQKTPKGCFYEENKQDIKELTTANRKYFIQISKLDPSDVIVYVKRDLWKEADDETKK